MEDRELNQARSKPDNQPVRTVHIFVHHYNSTPYCDTETVFIYIPLWTDFKHRIIDEAVNEWQKMTTLQTLVTFDTANYSDRNTVCLKDLIFVHKATEMVHS